MCDLEMRLKQKLYRSPFQDGRILNISPRQDPAAEGLAQPITIVQVLHCGCKVNLYLWGQGRGWLA